MFARVGTRRKMTMTRTQACLAPWLGAIAVLCCLGEAHGQASIPVDVKVGQGKLIDPGKLPKPLVPPLQFIAVGNPAIVDFFQLDRQRTDIRLIGKSLGSTEITVTDAAGTTVNYDVQVLADLDTIRKHLVKLFPDANLELSQLREKIVVEGQARSAGQVTRIVATIDSFIRSEQRVQLQGQVGDQDIQNNDPQGGPPLAPGVVAGGGGNAAQAGTGGGGIAAQGGAGGGGSSATAIVNQVLSNQVQVINLIRIPTSQQVLLKVRVAELNRTGFREIGADLLASIPQFNTLFGTQIAGNGFGPGRVGGGTSTGDLTLGSQATLFGTFSKGQFNIVINALRRNNLVKILAEPNLVALNGHQASFLAGGEFPVPSFSGVGAGSPSGGGTSSTQFKEFGVRLAFLPIILDGETIRLTVDPEVSSVDISLATTLVPGGSPVPGLNVRKSHTTVELRQGETLAIAGLMQLELDGSTQKIPGLGDLPYIGGFFSNTTSNRVEKELIVLVTPYIIEPMAPGQVPPSPGAEVVQPNDLEFFFLNRIEGRTGIDGRSTTSYDDPLHLIRHSIVERKCLIGPSGFSK